MNYLEISKESALSPKYLNYFNSIVLETHQKAESTEFYAVKSKASFKNSPYFMMDFSLKSKCLWHCNHFHCQKCEKKRKDSNRVLSFGKDVIFCRNCSWKACRRNEPKYDNKRDGFSSRVLIILMRLNRCQETSFLR